MSTRYVWDRYNVAYGNETTTYVSQYAVNGATSYSDDNFYFSTGITTASDGSYTLTGTIISSKDMSKSDECVYTSAWTYKYGAKAKTGNVFYLENTDFPQEYGNMAYWCFAIVDSGGGKYGRVVLRPNSSSADAQYTFKRHQLSAVKGSTKTGTLSSNSSGAYPSDGLSGSGWYVYIGSDSIDPIGVAYDTDRPERGKAVKVIAEPSTSYFGGTISYLYQYSVDSGKTWTNAGAVTTDTEKEIIVPDKAEQFMARVRAQDDMGFVSADYVSGSNLAVQTVRAWVGVDGKARRVKRVWVGVGGKAHEVAAGWVGDENGKARRWF